MSWSTQAFATTPAVHHVSRKSASVTWPLIAMRQIGRSLGRMICGASRRYLRCGRMPLRRINPNMFASVGHAVQAVNREAIDRFDDAVVLAGEARWFGRQSSTEQLGRSVGERATRRP